MKRKAVFLDRDGVINRDFGYIGTIERFEFLPEVPWALKRLKDLGYATVVVTNQSGIARGMYSEADHLALMDYMQQELAKSGAALTAHYYCPHHPEAQVAAYRIDCACRKPQPGMLLKAQADLGLDLTHSIMVGDHLSDLRAGAAAQVGNLVLVGTHLDEAQDRTKLEPSLQNLTCFADLPSWVRALERGDYQPR